MTDFVPEYILVTKFISKRDFGFLNYNCIISHTSTVIAWSGHCNIHNWQYVHFSESSTMGKYTPFLFNLSDFIKTFLGQTNIQISQPLQ